MIEFQNVSYTYNKGNGVTNLNFSIDDGDFVFLIGSTGTCFFHNKSKILF